MANTMSAEQVNLALARKRRNAKIGRIAAISFIYLVLAILYAPLVYTAIFSFTESEIVGYWSGFSINNYIDLFKFGANRISQDIWNAALNTALVAISAGALATILGTLGAIGIYYLRKKWMKSTMDFVTQIPIVNAEIVTAVSLAILFVFFAKNFGLQRSFLTLVIGHTVLAIPYVVISVKPKLEQMDPALYEAAMDLGATQTQSLFKVIIPDIVPGILSGFLLSVTLSLDDYVITAFTKPTTGNFNTISTYVDAVTKKGGLPAQLRAFTTILFVVILLVMVLMGIKGSRDAKKNMQKGEK